MVHVLTPDVTMRRLATSIQTRLAMMDLAYSLLTAQASAAETSSKMLAETATMKTHNQLKTNSTSPGISNRGSFPLMLLKLQSKHSALKVVTPMARGRLVLVGLEHGWQRTLL
jgi:hypothetical protein